jgi:Zn-dependent protease with chaperone function
MYGNFIYFILVLLIYSTYIPPQEPYFSPFETLMVFLGLLSVFVVTTRSFFRSLSNRIDVLDAYGLHGQFDRLFTRQAIMAIVLFSVHVYVLNLKLFVEDLPLLKASPTCIALLFIALFASHLAIIWMFAYEPYTQLFQARISRRSYVISNMAFHFPVILPWLLISIGIDIINHLPYQAPKDLLARPEGQLVFFSTFLVALVVVAPSLIKVFWGCGPLPPGPKRLRIESMCRKAGLGYNNILQWPIFEGRLLTAGVMGLVKRFRFILVTESLLRILDDDELDAVVAHEIGHIKRRHLLFYLVFFIGFIVLSYAVFDLLLYAMMYGNLTFPILRSTRAELPSLTSILFTVAMATILLVYFRFVFGFFMRNCERQADLYAFSLLGNSRGLVSSLEKIAVHSGHAHDRPSWHHFSIRQRIDYLEKCESDRRWIVRHDRKLRRSIGVFIIGLLSTGYLGYAMNFGKMGHTLNSHFLQTVLTKEIEQNPDNPRLYTMLASLYYENQAYGRAIANYTKAIDLAPFNAEALNNLAWLLATCERQEYRDSERALPLAKQAAALSSEPHVLDTLAESYFINGYHAEAIAVITEALAKNPKDRQYYESQLKKFEKKARLNGSVNGEQ